jgi:hypothetical protein
MYIHQHGESKSPCPFDITCICPERLPAYLCIHTHYQLWPTHP